MATSKRTKSTPASGLTKSERAARTERGQSVVRELAFVKAIKDIDDVARRAIESLTARLVAVEKGVAGLPLKQPGWPTPTAKDIEEIKRGDDCTLRGSGGPYKDLGEGNNIPGLNSPWPTRTKAPVKMELGPGGEYRKVPAPDPVKSETQRHIDKLKQESIDERMWKFVCQEIERAQQCLSWTLLKGVTGYAVAASAVRRALEKADAYVANMGIEKE